MVRPTGTAATTQSGAAVNFAGGAVGRTHDRAVPLSKLGVPVMGAPSSGRMVGPGQNGIGGWTGAQIPSPPDPDRGPGNILLKHQGAVVG